MSSVQAETLLYYLQNQKQVSFAKVYDRTCDAVINYTGDREDVIRLLQEFRKKRNDIRLFKQVLSSLIRLLC